MPRILLYFLILFLAACLRLDFLYHSKAVIDADEAIVGLMAKHILEGREIPTFYYGQHYMGSFEALVVAVFFYLFGISNWALLIVPTAFSLVFLFLLYQLSREIISERAAILALIFASLPPAALLIWSTKARGGFIELMCIGTGALICAVRGLKQPHERGKYLVYTGLWLGFGWWVNNQIIYFILPIALFYFFELFCTKGYFIKILSHFILGIIAFFIGSLPYWLYNLKNNFISFAMFKSANSADLADHFGGLFELALPILMGAKRFWHVSDVFPFASILAWALLFVCICSFCLNRKSELFSLLRARIDRKQPIELILIFFFVCLLVFTFSSFGYLYQAPRYLLPSYIAIFIILAFTVDLLLTKRLYLLALIVCGIYFSLAWASSFYGGRDIPGEPIVYGKQRVAKDHTELISWLNANHYHWIRTNYWIGYRIAFETKEQVKFLFFGEPHQTRIPEYETEGAKYGRNSMPMVLVPEQARLVRLGLQAQGVEHKTHKLKDYVIFYAFNEHRQVGQEIKNDRFTISVSDRSEYANLAVDNQSETRWRSARAQSPGMYYQINFKEAVSLKTLEYDLAAWPQDYPRGMIIEIEHADGSKRKICNKTCYQALHYLLEGDSKLVFAVNQQNVKSIKLMQTGSHPVFDWTIAELSLFE